MLTRRSVLGQLAAIGAVGIGNNTKNTLGSLAAARKITYGSSVSKTVLSQDKIYSELVATQCKVIVPEGELKWKALRPDASTFAFESADWLLNYATQNDISMRGHTLLWHGSMPDWLNHSLNAGNGELLLTVHIAKVVGHYAGRLSSWDVVNEVLAPNDKQQGLWRKSLWFSALGPKMIPLAFHEAARADPRAILVWNENGLEEEHNPEHQAKRDALVGHIRSFRSQGVPIHAVGIQSHLDGSVPGTGGQNFQRFLAALRESGVRVFITELDVSDNKLPADIQARDTAVAAVYERYLRAVLDNSSVDTVLTWGLSDKYSWLADFRPRDDGLAIRPLPFDKDMKPKNVYQQMSKNFMAR